MVDSVKLLNATHAYKTTASQQIPDGDGHIAGVSMGEHDNTGTFSTMVSHALDNVGETIGKGEVETIKSLVDESSLAEVANAVTEAELSLRTVVAIRDRIISAYQDIIKMPI